MFLMHLPVIPTHSEKDGMQTLEEYKKYLYGNGGEKNKTLTSIKYVNAHRCVHQTQPTTRTFPQHLGIFSPMCFLLIISISLWINLICANGKKSGKSKQGYGDGCKVMFLVKYLIFFNCMTCVVFFGFFIFNNHNAFLFSQVGVITIINLLFLSFIWREI